MKVRLAAAFAAALLLAALAAPAAAELTVEAARRNATAPAEIAPVTRVVQLLEELKARIGQDGTSEQEAYDKFACWCEKATQKKAEEITTLKTKIGELGQTILQQKGKVAIAAAELQELAKQIAENEKAQKAATAIRKKENEAFLVEKAELHQATAALEKAIIVLRSATSGASLRQRQAKTSVSSALSAVQIAVQRLPPRAKPKSAHLLALGRAAGKEGYTPQSGTIQGILSDMYHSFASTLEQRVGDEATAHRNYEDLMATYQKELNELQETVVKKQRIKTEAEIMMADAEQEFDDSTKQLKADIEYFDATKASCQQKTEEWSARKALRTEETQGIQEALDILTSEDAKGLFSKAIQPGIQSFFQLRADNDEPPAKKAVQTLQAHARKAQSIRLATLAADLKEVEAAATQGGAVGHFEKVVIAIDELVKELRAEEVADQQKVDSCQEQYHEIDLTVNELGWKVKNNKAQIGKLEDIIEQKGKDKEEVVGLLADVQADIGYMEGNRTEENALYLAGKSDDEKAIALLEQAKGALQKYFSNHSIEMGPLQSLLQGNRSASSSANGTEWDKPEAKFSDKSHRKVETKGVVALLANIIEDLQSELVASKNAEEAAQLDFEKRHAAAKKMEEELQAKDLALEQAIALRGTELNEENEKLGDNQLDISTQSQTRDDLKPNCDFMINNIDERRRKRADEMEGLGLAKEYLAGASPVTMLQKQPSKLRRRDGFLGLDFKAIP